MFNALKVNKTTQEIIRNPVCTGTGYHKKWNYRIEENKKHYQHCPIALSVILIVQDIASYSNCSVEMVDTTRETN